MRTVIQHARLQDARGEHGVHDLYLCDGVIEGIDREGPVDATYDAAHHLVTPAFLDLHAHLRVPGQEVKEDLVSGLSAAVAGGFGTVVSMANTWPVVDDPGVVFTLIEKAERLKLARLRPAAALSRGLRGEQLTDFATLQRAGAIMISDCNTPVANSNLQRRACEYASELGLVIQTHAEDPSLAQQGVMNEGLVSHRIGLPGNPVAAESAMIFRDCEIARMTGARVHISHVSSQRGMQVVEWFKEQGAPVTAEVTPYHLTLTDDLLAAYDPVVKVSPPLRTAADRDYLQDALRRGVIDNIATNHAPHTQAEKEQDLLAAPFGIACLDVAFPVLYTALVRSAFLPLDDLLAHLQDKPAQVMGWPAPTLEPGQPADLTVLDLDTPRPVDPATFQSKAKFSPWDQQTLYGWPVATFVRGQCVYQRAPHT